jgi:hypothetical protein
MSTSQPSHEALRAFHENRAAILPALEAALHEWVVRMENQHIPINGDLIKATASRLFQKMPEYYGTEEPKWSEGWLGGFKGRFHIRKYKQAGDSGSVDRGKAEGRLRELQDIVASYASHDIYNADETGLYWLATPEYTLATKKQSGKKQKRNRVTIFPTVNADGSHKLSLWVIGQYATPRSFGKGKKNIQGLPLVWRNNPKAWMTSTIFKEYLEWFDGQMGGRKVLLLVDGFSAHESALKQNPSLNNTRVEFLAANTTSLYQPLDQGIINNLKLHYRRIWLDHMVRLLDDNRDPFQETPLLLALHWITDVWATRVTSTTIANCFKTSLLLGPIYGPERRPEDWEEEDEALLAIKAAAIKLRSIGAIQEVMQISNFINPEEEAVNESPDDLLDFLAELYSSKPTMEEEQEEGDATMDMSFKDGLKGLEAFMALEMQQDDCSFELLVTLRKRFGVLEARKAKATRQTTLNAFLNPPSVEAPL